MNKEESKDQITMVDQFILGFGANVMRRYKFAKKYEFSHDIYKYCERSHNIFKYCEFFASSSILYYK